MFPRAAEQNSVQTPKPLTKKEEEILQRLHARLKMPQARNSCFFFFKLDSISFISLVFKTGPVP